MRTLKRGAPQYIEIENFKDYELTPCVAYEMAIRNQAFIEATQRVVDFYQENKKVIDCMLLEPLQLFEGLSEPDLTEAINKYSEISFKFFRLLEKTMFYRRENGPIVSPSVREFNADLFYILEKISKYGEKELLDEMSYYDREREIQYGLDPLRDGYILFTKSIQREGYIIDNIGEVPEEEIGGWEGDEYIPIPNSLDEIREVIKGGYEGIFTATTSISPSFSRPILYSDQLESRRVSLELNLSLPLDELVAYLKHVKQDIERNPDIAAAPIELLGEKLQAADDISKMCITTKKGYELCFDGRKGATRTQKIADMFFIYDSVKSGTKEFSIRMALSEYYESIGKKTDMSDKTFRKYRDIAKDYIDNQRYLELLQGTKAQKK